MCFHYPKDLDHLEDLHRKASNVLGKLVLLVELRSSLQMLVL